MPVMRRGAWRGTAQESIAALHALAPQCRPLWPQSIHAALGCIPSMAAGPILGCVWHESGTVTGSREPGGHVGCVPLLAYPNTVGRYPRRYPPPWQLCQSSDKG